MKTIVIVILFFNCLCIENNNTEKNEIENIKEHIRDIFLLFQKYSLNLISPFNEKNKEEEEYPYLNSLISSGALLINYFLHIKSDFPLDNDFIENFENNITESTEAVKFFLQKLIFDSTKNKNDVSTYRFCSELYYKEKNIIFQNKTGFFIVIINKKESAIEEYSKNKEKYSPCLNNINSTGCNNLTIIPFPSFKLDDLSYSFGFCLPIINCTHLIKNYQNFIIKAFLSVSNVLELNKNHESKELNIILIKNMGNNDELTIDVIDFMSFIPLYIIIFIILFMCFSKLPQFLFKSCFQKDSNQIKKSKNFDRTQFNNFSKKFFLRANLEELFNYKNPPEKINNETGLSYIKGIRGLSMIFASFGFLFICLLNSPVSIYSPYDFSDLLKNLFYSIFFGGIRYAPRLLLSCSGYILVYKFICFLDEKNDEEIEKKIKEYNENKNSSEISLSYINKNNNENDDDNDNNNENDNDNDNNNENENDNNDDDNDTHNEVNDDNLFENSKKKSQYENLIRRKRKVEDVKFSFLFQFYFHQIHKYIFYILVLSFCLFSLPILYKIEASLYSNNLKRVILSPTWQLFLSYYINPIFNSFDSNISSLDINATSNNYYKFLNLTLGYTSTYSFHYQGYGSENLLYFFWLFSNEFIFFMVSTFFLFIGYKYKIHIDKFFKFVIVITVFAKVIIFCIYEQFRNSSLYYYVNYFGSFFVNPLYNYIYYSIGIYFGSINYIIQKRISYVDVDNQEKPFLMSFIPVVNFYQQKGNLMKILNLFLLIFIISSNFLYYIYAKIYDKEYESRIYLNEFETQIFSFFNHFYLSFDIEIVVYLTHLCCCLYFIDNNNYINDLLSNPFWSILNKLYTSFLLVLNPTILFILFQSGMRINLNIFNCIFYTLISDFIAFIICVLCYIFFELPSKRIVKLIVNKSKKPKEIE